MRAHTEYFKIGRFSERYQTLVAVTAAAALLVLAQVINPVFIAAAIAALIGTAIAYFRPLAGFLCYLVAIQIVDYFKRLLLAFDNPPLIEWYGILLLPDLILFSAMAGVLASGDNLVGSRTPKYRAVAWALGLYAGWYTLRTIWTAAPLVNAAGKWKLVVPYFICFYLGERLLSNKAALCSALKVLAVTVGIASLYALWQFFFGLSGFEQRWLFESRTILAPETLLYGEGLTRAFSFYSDADTFGSVLACVGTLLLFSRSVFGRSWWNALALLALIDAALLATVVRAAWLHAFFGGIVFLWMTWRARRVRKFAAVLGLAGLLASAGWWTATRAVDFENPLLARAVVLGTYSARTIGYQNLFAMGIVEFIVGKGVGTMPGSVKDIAGTSDSEAFIAHDLISDLLYELGWIGLGLFAFLIVRTLVGSSPQFLGSMGAALKYIVWGVPVIAVLFGGSLLVVRPVTTLLWASAGLLCTADVSPARKGVF